MFKRNLALTVILLVCFGPLHYGLAQAQERGPAPAASAPPAAPDAAEDQKPGSAPQGLQSVRSATCALRR